MAYSKTKTKIPRNQEQARDFEDAVGSTLTVGTYLNNLISIYLCGSGIRRGS